MKISCTKLRGFADEARARRLILPLIASGFFMALPAGRAAAQTKTSCLECHSQLDPPLKMTSEEFITSIHGSKGITCAGCHGGDPTSDDPTVAMSPAKGFRGHIERKQIPELCAKCHSDAAYIRNFNPSLRTDQFSQYQTSVHGKRLAKGDTNVAVCVDCHGVHDIQPPNDPRAHVYPLNVATTCARCHANAEYMKPYNIPTNQVEQYSHSVHHEALVVQGDLSAPTCSTCHGSHGAAPPGVDSVARVCSTCHVFQAQIFDTSPHKSIFAAMGLPGCMTCHLNHGIKHPTDEMIGTDKDAICMTCHTQGDAGSETAQQIHEGLTKLDGAIARSDEILGRAERSGMEISEAKLAQSEARDHLTKARVELHSVNPARVDPEILAGLKVANLTYQAGQSAMAEMGYRRKGLLVSLATIVSVLIGLFLMIRKIESKGNNP
jgi:predicted CXXCH cytochrome family protein